MNVWTEVGNFLHPIVNAAGVAGQAISTVTHAVVGGALSVAQGGSFLEGFASAGLGSVGGFAGADVVGNSPDSLFIRMAFVTSAGGLASELTGGKFANGAITASFAHLFNDERGGPENSQQHLEGVRQAETSISDRGFSILGFEVDVVVPGAGTRRYDLVVKDPLTSVVYGVEVKTTIFDSIFYKPDQVAKDVSVVLNQMHMLKIRAKLFPAYGMRRHALGVRL